ncbi:MAG: c-type cytochrome [Chitinophagaceae bacterium]
MEKRHVLLPVAVSLAIFISCNNPNSNARPSKEKNSSETNALVDNAGQNAPDEFKEGAQLVTSNDCLTCHKVADTSVGPSFQSIANKYENIEANVNKLLVSVQKGSSGIWGSNTMTPHPNLTPQDGTKILHYILSNRRK